LEELSFKEALMGRYVFLDDSATGFLVLQVIHPDKEGGDAVEVLFGIRVVFDELLNERRIENGVKAKQLTAVVVALNRLQKPVAYVEFGLLLTSGRHVETKRANTSPEAVSFVDK